MNKEAIIAGIVAVVVLGGVAFLSNPQITVNAPVTPAPVTVNVPPQNGDVNVEVPQLGAVTVLTSPQDWNGVTKISEKYDFRVGSSTVVSHKITATSTLDIFCQAKGDLAFAQEYEIAVGSTYNGTSTKSLGKFTVPANTYTTILATTSDYVFTPSAGGWINVKMATSSGTTINTAIDPDGTCYFEGSAMY